MAYAYGRKYCQLCCKRDRELGGNGLCPVMRRPAPSVKSPYELNFQLGVGPNPPGHDCPAFKPGDKKPSKAERQFVLVEDGLFEMDPEPRVVRVPRDLF